MIRPTDQFVYYLDEGDKSDNAPALVCRYGTMAFWIDYESRLRAVWPDDSMPDGKALAELLDLAVCGWRNLGIEYAPGASVASVLTRPQLYDAARVVPTASHLSEIDRKKSAPRSQSASDSSVAAVGESA